MKTPLHLFTLFIFASLFMGCASTSKAPDSDSTDAKSFDSLPEKGIVFLYRTSRAVGAAGQLSVKVNGETAGGTGPGTFFRWELSPGTYTFLSSTGESSAVVKVEVEKGKLYFLRQDARMGIDSGRVTLKEVDAKKGKDEVKKCKLLVSSYVPE